MWAILNRDELSDKRVDTNDSGLAWITGKQLHYFLQPWYNNLNKRIVKSPKLYFYDTGLLCHLLQIKSQTALKVSALWFPL